MAAEHFEVLGSVIAVDIPSAEDADRVRTQWARCMAPPGATAVSSVTYGTHDDPHRRDYGLASALTLAGITHAAGSRLMLHAAGVADPASARVAVLVASSGTGKTTAAHRLGAAGFGYVTDETVSIGADGGVLPYPKPLSVVIAGDSPHHKSQHGPDELGLAPCPPDPRAALIVLLDRAPADPDGDSAAAPATLERVPLLDGLIELIPQTSALPAMRRPLQTLAGTVRRAGGVWRLTYREIDDGADLVREALRARTPDQTEVAVLAPADDTSSRPHAGAEAPEGRQGGPADRARVSRAPYLDAIGVGDEVLVLIDSRPVRVSGLGTTIWTHATEPTSVEDLTALCVAEHGEHPQATQLVRAAVEELLRHDLLQRLR